VGLLRAIGIAHGDGDGELVRRGEFHEICLARALERGGGQAQDHATQTQRLCGKGDVLYGDAAVEFRLIAAPVRADENRGGCSVENIALAAQDGRGLRVDLGEHGGVLDYGEMPGL